MANKKHYVVCDENGSSWDASKDRAETFKSLAKAKTRAIEMAECSPGEIIFICEAIIEVCADVEPVQIKPI